MTIAEPGARPQKQEPPLINQNGGPTNIVPGTGVEPVQPFLATGFSCHYGFRHLSFVVRTIPSPWTKSLGVSCLVSAPSSNFEAWLKITIGVIR